MSIISTPAIASPRASVTVVHSTTKTSPLRVPLPDWIEAVAALFLERHDEVLAEEEADLLGV